MYSICYIRFTIFDLRFDNVAIWKFENEIIRLSSARRSPLEIEDSTIPKKNQYKLELEGLGVCFRFTIYDLRGTKYDL